MSKKKLVDTCETGEAFRKSIFTIDVIIINKPKRITREKIITEERKIVLIPFIAV
ncbi:hypothetical protein J6TS7_26050 [Paenibacillus dendritiformis]|nr:hypothetical protein J6TS7_26050 [Paenibacillus dendritiformis]